ncbi:YfiM family protein [Pendulispora albinea]|uniref:Lipoprotein n=1 Tax=Pendulispora albinea TaxID=2741071 RepID=A0ABZ2LNC1_9BACT
MITFPPSSARAEAASDPDPWFGRDKVLHFSVAALIASGTYTLAATQFEARYPPLLLGAGTTLVLGAAKEAYDGLGHGTPSWKDFTWDVIGAVVGLGVAWGLDLVIRGISDEHPLFSAPHHVAKQAPSEPGHARLQLGPGRGLILTW